MSGGSLRGVRTLVTGASGFIGSHVVERLAAEGSLVAALARSRGRLTGVSSRFAFLTCDITSAAETREAVEDWRPEVVFHFASHPDGAEAFEHMNVSMATNLTGTLNVLEALRLAGGGTFLYGGSCKIYGGDAAVPYRESSAIQPNSSYAISKLAGWHVCDLYRRLYGMATILIQPTLIYGPRQGYNIITYVVERLLDGHAEIPLDGGAQTRDPLFVADAVDAFLAAAVRGPSISGRIVNIGGGFELSVEELAQEIVALSGRRVPVVCHPERMRPTEMRRSFCDNMEAEEILGWRPRTTLRHGLRETYEFIAAGRGLSAASTSAAG